MLPVTDVESEYLPTIESMSSERRKRKAVQAQLEAQKQSQLEAAAQPKQQDAPAARAKGGMEGLEEEADQQSAFNPETGEINWDCPCLGGMAHGPCGEEFKAAFSCFVYSTEEPKGMDCIDRFKYVFTRLYPSKKEEQISELWLTKALGTCKLASGSTLKSMAQNSTPMLTTRMT